MNRMTALALALSLTACTTNPTSELDDQDSTIALQEPATYQVVSTIGITAEAVLPATAYDWLQTIEGLRNDPAATMIVLLDDAGVPVVADLFDALPGELSGRIEGWINDYIETHVYEGTPVGAHIDALLALGDTVLTEVELVSELSLDAADADGRTAGTHRVSALRWRLDGVTAVDIAIPAAPAPFAEEARCTAEVGPGAEASLTIGDHAFGLRYGEYAWAALEDAAQRRYGMSVREALGAIVDCPALAAEVADTCLAFVCVGHAAQLESLCEQGLDLAVAEARGRLEALRFDAVRFASGTASMRGVRLEDGIWTAAIDLGSGARDVPATFTGVQIR